jgi:hypothetical protein
MRPLLLFSFLLILSSCQSVLGSDENLSLEGTMQAYGTEAANLRDDTQSHRTEVVMTVAAAGTQAADFERYNQSLRGTIVVSMPDSEDERILLDSAGGVMPIELYDLSNGEMRFVQVGTSSQIDVNGCFLAKQQFFPASSSVIYMTAMALNLRAGTVVRVDWQYGGELVYSNGWTAPQSLDGQCVAIEMRPSNAEFLEGNWTATLYVNGEAVDPYSFTIVGG